MPPRTYPPTEIIPAPVDGAMDVVLADDGAALAVISVFAYPSGLDVRLSMKTAPGLDMRNSGMRGNPNNQPEEGGLWVQLRTRAGMRAFSIVRGGGGESTTELELFVATDSDDDDLTVVLTWPEQGIHAEHAVDRQRVDAARQRVHVPRWKGEEPPGA